MYRYSLDPTSKKHICPACKKKTFVRYKDSATNADLPAQYGRCDRELECTYHLNPYQDGYAKGEASEYILKVEEPKPPSLHTMQIVDKSVKSRENNFAVFLTTLLGDDTGDHLLKWKVGTSNKKWQGATIFWYITQSGDVRAGKVMLYDPNTGKRVKASPTPISWAHVLLGLQDFNLSQCLFGEHLLTDKPICIVESEKTAIIASYYLPEFDWLATGGLSNLNERNTKVLSDKQVWLIPDRGGEEKWTEKAKYIEIKNGIKFNISKCLLGLEQGIDLADVLIESGRDKYIESFRDEITTHVAQVPATIATEKSKEYQRIEEIISFFHTNNLSASFEDSEKRMLAYSLGQAFARNDAIELFIKSLSLDKQVIETNPKVLYDQFIEQLPKGKSYSLGILVNIFKKKGFIPKEFNPQRFWEIGTEGGIKFYEENFIPFLRGLGFYQWTFDEKFYQFVRVDAHLVRIVNEKNIVATANTEIESSSARVKNRFDVICKEYTSKTKLQQLPVRDFAFKKCTLKSGYPSDYISIDAYLCIKEVIETEKGANALRNYSFFVSEDGLELLPRDKILTRMLMNRTEKRKQFADNSFPFVFCVTQGGKKHLTYKATVNYNNERYIITTDFGDVEFGINAQMLQLVGACQRFYAIMPDSKEDATWFTKDEILTGNYQSKRIETYGIEDWTRLENVIKPYHNTPLLRLLTFALNKLNENEFIC
jgi:hypothetical protein